MDAKVIWQQGMRFTGSSHSGFEVTLDAGENEGGANEGFRPLELMAISLVGCTGMDVISILKKKQQSVSGFEVKVQADRAEDYPKVFTHAQVSYLVTGIGLDEVAVRRAIELSTTKYCPVIAMLGQAVSMEFRYEIFEGQNPQDRTLLKSGTYIPPAPPAPVL